MRLAHGIDVVAINRFNQQLEIDDSAVHSRMFSERELEQCMNAPSRLDSLAGRFAAKEAVLKALGSGFGTGLSFREIEVLRSDGQAPHLVLSGQAKALAEEQNVIDWSLSISHSAGLAFASVIGYSS